MTIGDHYQLKNVTKWLKNLIGAEQLEFCKYPENMEMPCVLRKDEYMMTASWKFTIEKDTGRIDELMIASWDAVTRAAFHPKVTELQKEKEYLLARINRLQAEKTELEKYKTAWELNRK